MPKRSIETMVGALTLHQNHNAIAALTWEAGASDETTLLFEAEHQLRAYFSGDLNSFNLPLEVSGGPLQKAVCDAMLNIPLGETRTYGDLARELNRPAQAVGRACGGNPIPVIIPCHRIVGANSLGGFSGGTGIETKVALLKHEGAAGLLI
ncbi:MAG: methylated-DNA--[protein]-cysteine S-methyltransferase [Pseudomonadota bacterium]